MGPSRSPSPPTKRLLQELRDYAHEPLPFLDSLAPKTDSDLFLWEAVMRGPTCTAYEGSIPSPPPPRLISISNAKNRRPLAHPDLPPGDLPPRPAHRHVPHPHHPPQHLLPHGRDLPRSAEGAEQGGGPGGLDAGVYGREDDGGDLVAAAVSGGG
ncbi:MAG: hypothetical protein Q9211_006057 [Gyalolechia sp. 1 TL-2023]